MAFEQQSSVTRNPKIREMEITLFKTTNEDHPEGPYSARFRIAIDDQFDQPMNHLHGDLLGHLTTAQKTAIKNFVDSLWDKAEEEAIP